MSRCTPHSPLGAEASFDFGPAGEPAALRLPGLPDRPLDVYVGCRAGPREPWNLLPFFTPVPGGPTPLPKGRFGRFIALAGDKWMIGPLVFKLCTPFSLEPAVAGEENFHYAPVVAGYLEYDNSHGTETAELLFGLGATASALTQPAATGFCFGADHGFATAPSSEVQLRRGAEVFGAEIGPAAALHFIVPPESKRLFPLVLGFFRPGYAYGDFFADLAAALAFGVAQHARYVALSDARDAEFMRSPCPFDAKTQAAQAVRTWLSASRRRAGEAEIDLTPLRALVG